MPKVGREKPWHQDHAYFDVEVTPAPSGAPSNIVGIWLALDPADAENGCMHILAGETAAGPQLEPFLHWQRRDWQICDTDIAHGGCVPVPLKPGSLMLFSSLLPHGTPPNLSDRKRRALQWFVVPLSELCFAANFVRDCSYW